jgi:hypothetical protein
LSFSVTAIDAVCIDLENDARFATLAIKLVSPWVCKRCRSSTCQVGENSHHRVTDRLYDSVGLF